MKFFLIVICALFDSLRGGFLAIAKERPNDVLFENDEILVVKKPKEKPYKPSIPGLSVGQHSYRDAENPGRLASSRSLQYCL